MWATVINVVLGIWLMAAPGIFSYNGSAADNDHICGPIIVTFAIVSLSGCTRSIRKFNLPVAAWLLISPFVLSYPQNVNLYIDILTGLAVLGFSLIGRKSTESYGGGWYALFH